MKHVAALAGLVLAGCTNFTLPPSYWHASIPVKAEMRGEPEPAPAAAPVARLVVPSVPLIVPAVPPAPPPAPRAESERAIADRLVREALPFFREVSEAWEAKPTGKSERKALLDKFRKVESTLASALVTYLSLPAKDDEKKVIDGRTLRIQELLATLRGCMRQIEAAR